MDCDIAVVGGGMVGAAVALGFARAGFSVAVIEPHQPRPFEPGSAPDLRISAISAASVKVLKSLEVWSDVLRMRCVPYRGLETWEWPESLVSFRAEELGLSELGFMLENDVLQLALWQHLQTAPGVRLHAPAQLEQLSPAQEGWQITLQGGEAFCARLVVGADGANSRVRQWAGIGLSGWEYRQSCMLVTVQTQEAPQDVTWQQFTPHGPRAFLPLWDNWASLVWYDEPQRIRQLAAMPAPALTQEIRKTFPSRVGGVTAVAAGSFPLVRRHADCYVRDGLALVGDAAHTINPLAGQGVNLGYRDAEALLAIVTEARNQGEAWYSEEILRRYQHRRRPDNLMMQAGMDLFYGTFSNNLPPLRLLRNVGLMAAQRAGVLKKQALKYALGV